VIREIVLDTETTGLDPATGHRIVEIGAVELINHVPSGRTFHAYVNPERDVPAEACAVHGLSTEFLRDHPCFSAIVEDFESFILADKVTGDPEALARLESIVHPLVRREQDAFLEDARKAGHVFAVLDIPLLFETGRDKDFDAVVAVSAPEDVQKARVLARPGMTPEKFAAILARQMPDSEKRRRADFVVDTSQGLEPAFEQVRAIADQIESREKT